MKRILCTVLALVLVVSMITAAMADDVMQITWLADNPPLEDNSEGEQDFEAKFGVDVIIKRATTDDEKAVLYASGDIPDFIVAGSASEVAKLVDQGIVRTYTVDDVKTYMPEYYEMCVGLDPDFFTYGSVNGELYGFPRMNATATAGIGAAIRADWLQAVGKSVPTTVEELTEVFRAFTEDDPDGNGINDTYGLTAGCNTLNKPRAWFQSIFGIYNVNPFYWTTDADGNLVYGFVSDGAKKALTLLADWYAKGYIDPEFVTTDMRTSGVDVIYKFASGLVGYMDCVSYDDYEWDNDGHVSAKWVANSAEWQEFFTSTDDTKVLYQYDVTTDFSDELGAVGPYYINMKPVVNEDGVQGSYMNEGTVSTFFCFGANCSDEKMAKIMQILNQESTDEETYLMHFGREGKQWVTTEDGTRAFNPEYINMEDYHPQGQIAGIGWCLYPMYFSNPDLLTVISGDRYAQRYDRTMPVFVDMSQFKNLLTSALPSEAEYSELLSTYVTTNIVKAIRGEISMDDWDQVVADWYAQGGDQLTKEANEWYATIK